MPRSTELEDYDDLDYERYWQKYGGGEDMPSVALTAPRRARRVDATMSGD